MSYSFTSSNDINTSLVGNITATQTSIVVSSISGFPILPPGGVFPLKIIHPQTAGQVETIYVTSYSGTTLTVLRGQEGSTAYAWSNGDTVYSTITAAMVVPNPQTPQARLSASNTSPLYSAAEAATIIYYVPYNGGLVPYYNGSSWNYTILSTPISNNINDGTVNPAAMSTSQSAGLYVWNNNGVMTLTRGPAQASTSTTDPSINWINGMPMNASAITNGPPENQGLYVGSVSTYSSLNGNNAIYYMRDMQSTGSGDGDALMQLRNYFNQTLHAFGNSGTASASIPGSTNTWTASSSARIWITKLLGPEPLNLFANVQYSGQSAAIGTNMYVGIARQATPTSPFNWSPNVASDSRPVLSFCMCMSQQAENLVSVMYCNALPTSCSALLQGIIGV